MVGLDSGTLTGRRDECPGLTCHWTSCAIIARVPQSRLTSTYGGSGAWTKPARRPCTVLARYETEIYAPVEVFDTDQGGRRPDRGPRYLRPPGAGRADAGGSEVHRLRRRPGMPAEHVLLPGALGYAVFVMDTRGGRWTTRATGDRHGDPAAGPGSGDHQPAGLLQPGCSPTPSSPSRRRPAATSTAVRGERRQPGWRELACASATSADGRPLPRGRAVPVRHQRGITLAPEAPYPSSWRTTWT